MAGLLAMVGKSARLSQTLTAYFGCDLLLNVFVAIAISLSKLAGVDLLNNIALIILVWSVAVFGFILSRALEVHMILGSVLALVLIILTFSISQIAIGNS
jgi:ABC-type molybdate transport system permease subunit